MKSLKNSPFVLASFFSVVIHGVLLAGLPLWTGPAAESAAPAASRLTLAPLSPPPRPSNPASRPIRPAAAVPAGEFPAAEPPPAPAAEAADMTPNDAAVETAGFFTEENNGAPSTPADSAGKKNTLTAYEGIVRERIDRNKEYPYQSRRQEQEGTVRIRFTLTRDGGLLGDPLAEKNSRYPKLNAAALEAVKKAAPYPPFPPDCESAELTFLVMVSFSLR
jgi:protein TonB